MTEETGMVNRCWWCDGDPLYERYHDQEWGQPSHDDRHLFEMLSLEAFQSGLSWITILRKREGFRSAFAEWDVGEIAAFDENDFARLMNDASIVRNRAKINAVIHNAGLVPGIIDRAGSLDAYFWSFAPVDRAVPAGGYTRETLPLMIDDAKAMSKALKKDGFKFTGPMTCMSFMQSVGMVNDHVAGCDWLIH